MDALEAEKFWQGHHDVNNLTGGHESLNDYATVLHLP